MARVDARSCLTAESHRGRLELLAGRSSAIGMSLLNTYPVPHLIRAYDYGSMREDELG